MGNKEIESYIKNVKSMYSMFILYEYLLSTDKKDTLTLYALVERVIEDYYCNEECPSYKKDINVFQMIKILEIEKNNLIKKYNIPINEQIDLDYSHENSLLKKSLSSMPKETIERKFNLIEILSERNGKAISVFLSSNIPLKEKLAMFLDFLEYTLIKKEDFNTFHEVMNNIERNARNEIFKAYINKDFGKNNQSQLSMMLSKLFLKEKYYSFLELNDYFNLSNFRSQVPNKEKGFYSTTLAMICFRTQDIDTFIKLYESDSYLKVEDDIRKNDEIVIFENLDFGSIPKFIFSKNFKLNDQNIEFLSKRIIKELESNKSKENFDQYRTIKRAIIEKATTKEEVDTYFEYIKLLENKVEELKRKPIREKLIKVLNAVDEKAQKEIEEMPIKKLDLKDEKKKVQM